MIERINMTTALLIAAANFAAERHRYQRRKDVDATPYINHPLALAQVLAVEAGIDDPDVLCAALLHDTIEDTETTREDLEAAFGPRITAIVLEVTDDKSLPAAARKQAQIDHAPHISRKAKLVKLADKISNLRDLLASPPDWPTERKRAYFDWAAAVIAGLRGTNAKLEAIADGVLARIGELA